MAAHVELVVDCADPDRLADFWAAALGYERFGAAGQYRSIVDPDGEGPKLIFQQVPEPKTTKNRVHIDVHAEDIETEADRLVALGATRLDDTIDEVGTAWIPMADPEGNELCVCQAST